MSARTQMIRKLEGGKKPNRRSCGNYKSWAKGLQARLDSLFSWEGYLKHATHSHNVIRSINEDRARRQFGG